MNTKQTILTALVLASSISISNAALSVNYVSGDRWALSFDEITFTATGAGDGDFDWLVFEDFFQGNSTDAGDYGGSGTVDFELNSAATVNVTPTNSQGTYHLTVGGIDANDLLVNIANAGNRPAALSALDSVTVSGSFIFKSSDVPAFNTSGTVNATWYNNGGAGIASSDTVSVSVVPEPSSTLLLGMGALGLIARRKRF